MTATLTRPPEAPRHPLRGVVIVVAVVLAATAAYFVVSHLVREPAVVPRVEIRNETPDLLDVLVRGDRSDGLVPVAIVEPERAAVAEDVVDQGERWTFVVRVAGRTVMRLERSRAQLERAGWVVTVPASQPAPTPAP